MGGRKPASSISKAGKPLVNNNLWRLPTAGKLVRNELINRQPQPSRHNHLTMKLIAESFPNGCIAITQDTDKFPVIAILSQSEAKSLAEGILTLAGEQNALNAKETPNAGRSSGGPDPDIVAASEAIRQFWPGYVGLELRGILERLISSHCVGKGKWHMLGAELESAIKNIDQSFYDDLTAKLATEKARADNLQAELDAVNDRLAEAGYSKRDDFLQT